MPGCNNWRKKKNPPSQNHSGSDYLAKIRLVYDSFWILLYIAK